MSSEILARRSSGYGHNARVGCRLCRKDSLAACALAEVRALKIVDFPTLGRPTIPQFNGIMWFPCYEAVPASWVSFTEYLFVGGFAPSGNGCPSNSKRDDARCSSIRCGRLCVVRDSVCADDAAHDDNAGRCADAGADAD